MAYWHIICVNKGRGLAMRKVRVNMTIDEDLDGWLERMAGELRMNKSQFINNVISATKDEVKVLKAIGLFNLGKMLMKGKEKRQNIMLKKIPVNMTIDEDLDGWLEKMAGELRMNKSQFINNVISATKDDLKVLKAIGWVQLSKAAMRVKDKALSPRRKSVAAKEKG
jgi:hypothetical protein